MSVQCLAGQGFLGQWFCFIGENNRGLKATSLPGVAEQKETGEN